jgi:hypothetical protein
VGSDEIAVQDALGHLIDCGLITPHPLTSGTLFGLTRDEQIRAWLRATYGSAPVPSMVGARPPAHSASPFLVTDAPTDRRG